MKTLKLSAAVMAVSLIWSVSLLAQGDKELPEVAQQGKPDFAVESVAAPAGTEKQEKVIPNSYIVILKADKHPPFAKGGKKFSSREEQAEEAKKFEDREARKIKTLARAKYKVEESAIQHIFTSGFTGFVATIPDGEAKGFMAGAKGDADVESFYQDFEVQADAVLEEVIPAEEMLLAQTVPWGIGFTGYANQTVGTKFAWVLDTGIDLDHPDLNVQTNATWARSFISGQTIDDGHGHGTHVAGTIAAKNNTIGVVGVAANTWVVPVKVLSNTGGGSWSGVLAGINHVYNYLWAGDVMNLSLGGAAASTWDIENKLYWAGQKGAHVVLAAGNENVHASTRTPARANGLRVYTISAMDSYCRIASFSNYGNPPVDGTAPGVSVLSTYKGGAYATMSGTSMAAPHVAGLMALTNGSFRSFGCCSGTLCTDKDTTKDKVMRR
jgi:subtilisin family serine protease